MRKYFGLLVKGSIRVLERLHLKVVGNTTDTPPAYNSLAPIGTADEDRSYYNAILWALSNRTATGIKNIAVTGPYGSGKTSILKTFQRVYKENDLHFLHISLATFKEELTKTKTSENDVLRLIEISILQQIFYHEDDSKIPDSRFKKIRSYSKKQLWLAAIGLMVFILALLQINNGFVLKNILSNVSFSESATIGLHYVTYGIAFSGALVILSRSIRLLTSLTLNKLTIQNAEIGLGGSFNKSILNNHLDEIVYFFEVTPYNVVIIEDLDRFQQTEIFTKLREINLILNSSEKTRHKHIVFIYAVRDEMFKDNDRTKFFDFIIPVIPIINSSNSSQILLRKRQQHGYMISDELIDNLSLFIDDMRLLHNIMNEFHLHKLKLDSNLNQDKLLSMVVYKNLYPYDFTLLSKNEGDLFNHINAKQQIVSHAIVDIDSDIQKLKLELETLVNLKVIDIKELRKIYVFDAMTHLPDFFSFYLTYTTISTETVLEDANFDALINGQMKYTKNPHNQGSRTFGIAFSEVEKRVGAKSYQIRKNEIESLHTGKVEVIRTSIQELERKKSELKTSKLKDILKTFSGIYSNDESKGMELLKVMLRSGYIGEDYIDYISIFHEGSITRTDHQFLLNVRSQKRLDIGYKLNKLDKLLPKIALAEFETEYILNFDLLEHLIKSKSYNDQQELVFKKLSDQSTESIDFIEKYLDYTSEPRNFIQQLAHYWKNIWKYIDSLQQLPSVRKQLYYKHILEYANLNDLKSIASVSPLKVRIENDNQFLSLLDNNQRLMDIIVTLQVKLQTVDLTTAPKELMEYIYEQDHNDLNIEMIRTILEFKGKLDKSIFQTQNYTAIKNSALSKLLKRIDDELQRYITHVYLKLPQNVSEGENNLSELINKSISVESVELILKHVQTRIRLDGINDLEKRSAILKTDRISAEWGNLLICYKDREEELTEDIVNYVNKIENATALSTIKIPTNVDDKDIYSRFWRKMITCNDLSDEAYDIILQANPWIYPNLSTSDLSEEKATSLVRKRVLKLTTENLSDLKENFTELNVMLLEYNKSSYLANLSAYPLDADDLLLILVSSKFLSAEKSLIVNQVPASLIVSNTGNLAQIAELVIKDVAFQLSDEIIKPLLLTSAVDINQRIKVLNLKHTQVTKILAREVLNGLGEPYSDININGKRPLLEKSAQNFKLAEILWEKSMISSYDEEKEGIRVVTFRKPQE